MSNNLEARTAEINDINVNANPLKLVMCKFLPAKFRYNLKDLWDESLVDIVNQYRNCDWDSEERERLEGILDESYRSYLKKTVNDKINVLIDDLKSKSPCLYYTSVVDEFPYGLDGVKIFIYSSPTFICGRTKEKAEMVTRCIRVVIEFDDMRKMNSYGMDKC